MRVYYNFNFMMNIKFTACLLLISTLAACTGNTKPANENSATVNNTADSSDINLNGQWFIENISLNDSVKITPTEEVPERSQYFIFADSTYSIMTNCNSFNGSIAIKGDSIMFGDGMMTEMACDNMATEDALRKILPSVVRMDMENDSIVRLCTDTPSQYIMLHKAKIEVK